MLRPSEPKPAPRRPASRCRSSRDIRSGYHFFGQYGASQAADVEAEQTRSAFLVGVQTAAGANALFEQRLDPASGRVDFLLWQPDAFVSSLTEDLFTDLDAPDVNGLSLHVIWSVGRQYQDLTVLCMRPRRQPLAMTTLSDPKEGKGRNPACCNG